jgi:hypothetical protein
MRTKTMSDKKLNAKELQNEIVERLHATEESVADIYFDLSMSYHHEISEGRIRSACRSLVKQGRLVKTSIGRSVWYRLSDTEDARLDKVLCWDDEDQEEMVLNALKQARGVGVDTAPSAVAAKCDLVDYELFVTKVLDRLVAQGRAGKDHTGCWYRELTLADRVEAARANAKRDEERAQAIHNEQGSELADGKAAADCRANNTNCEFCTRSEDERVACACYPPSFPMGYPRREASANCLRPNGAEKPTAREIVKRFDLTDVSDLLRALGHNVSRWENDPALLRDYFLGVLDGTIQD